MHAAVELALLSLALLLGTVAAAILPIALKPRPHQTDAMIAFAAGVLLGAAFFHLLPEAVHDQGPRVLFGTLAGVLTLLLIERAVHRHAKHAGEVEVHGMMHGHHGRASSGLTAFIGLSVHTLSDGFALGSSLAPGLEWVVFCAIFAHQLPTSFSLSALLRSGGRSVAWTLAACTFFALMVPVGATVYLLAQTGLSQLPLMPWTLAFSAGNFLHLALGDLLPDLRRSQARPLPLGLAVGGGMLVMAVLHFVLE
jgi:zinc and cadmium transporter